MSMTLGAITDLQLKAAGSEAYPPPRSALDTTCFWPDCAPDRTLRGEGDFLGLPYVI